MRETEFNGGRFGCFTAGDVICKRSISLVPRPSEGLGTRLALYRHLIKLHTGVIPNHFSKSLQVTPSELDETWFVSTTCGFMKPDKMLLSYVVWLPD